jgi:moderate conductance mechanosensitive channel
MFLLSSFSALQTFVPTSHEFNNVAEVLHQWRTDALEFLRQDVPRILVIIFVYVILIWVLRVFTNRLRKLSKRQAFPSGIRSQQLATLAGVMNGVGVSAFVFLALIQILGVVGINVGPLLASAGIAGLAIGFGAQTLVKDVINGFFILLENQYDVGDVVRVGGVQGTVEYMTLRRTVLRDGDGTVHTVPNSEIKIVSNTTRDWTQISLHISVAYTEDSDRVVGLLREVGREIWNADNFKSLLVSEPDVAGIERVTGNEVDYLMLVKTRPGKHFQVSRELRRRIKECFQKNNIKPGGPGKVYVADETRP